MNYSLPGPSVRGISQTGILEWVATSFSKGSSWTRDRTRVSCIGRQVLYHLATWEALFPIYKGFEVDYENVYCSRSTTGKISGKDRMVNIFGSAGHMLSAAGTLLL